MSILTMDISDLFKKKTDVSKTEQTDGSRSLIMSTILFILLIVMFLLGYFYFWPYPMLKDQEWKINEQERLSNDTSDKKEEIQQLEKTKQELSKERNEKLKLFSTDQEVEDLHNTIISSAAKNSLTVSFERMSDEEPVFEKTIDPNQTVDANNPISPDYYKIFIKFEINGSFKSYMNLRSEIAQNPKIIMFEKELIKRQDNNEVKVEVLFSLVKMPTLGEV